VIIKRISDALLSRRWRDVLVELLIVIVGVFLAIQVENWNEGRKELAQEKVLLESLRDDFVENQRIGKHRIGQYTRAEAAALELRRVTQTETELNAEKFYTLINDA
jgi:hypothetical protein